MKCYKCGIKVGPGLHQCPIGNPVFYGLDLYPRLEPIRRKKKPYTKPTLSKLR